MLDRAQSLKTSTCWSCAWIILCEMLQAGDEEGFKRQGDVALRDMP